MMPIYVLYISRQKSEEKMYKNQKAELIGIEIQTYYENKIKLSYDVKTFFQLFLNFYSSIS